ncbi:MAG: DUF1003 domain-containing protein [Chloroflexota bacterium]|nr:DUF1003 domain-containing protein [Chloroflexota bacterium]
MVNMKQATTGAIADYVEAPTRVRMYAPRTVGERIADRASASIGSWKFIIIQTGLVIVWVIVNFTGFLLRWDPYPFILLNLMFSVQAAYTGPILLLAGNRQATKDRALAERDDAEIGMLLKLQQEQCAVLALLNDAQAKHTEMLEILHGRGIEAPESAGPKNGTSAVRLDRGSRRSARTRTQAGTASSAKAAPLKS